MNSKKKAIVRVFGGLGNQLFIYAFARSIALKYNIPVFLETRTGFMKDPYKRKYRLKYYKIKLPLCSIIDSFFYPLRRRYKKTTKLLFPHSIYVPESCVDSFDKLISYGNKFFFEGYWQKEDYFNEYFNIIKDELKLNINISQMNIDLATKIAKSNSVAVHVRMIQNDNILSKSYYDKAIIELKKKLENPVFYVFSDNIDWCKKNFVLDDKFIHVKHDAYDEISDLWLMSKCKHFLIANSTFSWWGSCLSENKNKIVISPKT
jgi:hypothetical protein